MPTQQKAIEERIKKLHSDLKNCPPQDKEKQRKIILKLLGLYLELFSSL